MPVLNHAAKTGRQWQGLDFHNPPRRRLWKTLSQTFSFGETIRFILKDPMISAGTTLGRQVTGSNAEDQKSLQTD